MSVDGWNTLLVLGGIRSGKSEFAESLLSDAPAVRYLATGAGAGPDDSEWAARVERHRARRPGGWTTEEITDPSGLAELISAALPDETLLVDDLGGWVTALLDPAHRPADEPATITKLATAVRYCVARLVLVSPEVGLSLVPTTEVGRAFTDTLGATNRAVADACDAVVLVVAGQPAWLKPEAPARTAAVPAQPVREAPVPQPALPEVLTPAAEPAVNGQAPRPGAARVVPAPAPPTAATGPAFESGMALPMPDENAGPQALDRLHNRDVPGTGLGVLERLVSFAAATQATPTPAAWDSVRVLLLHGDHEGGAAAGAVPGESARRAAQARAGLGPLARLAAGAGAGLQVVEAPSAAPMEAGPALDAEAVESALRYGWHLAEAAADAGVQLLVLAACGAGTDAAAAAVLAATAGAEAPAVLSRVVAPGGRVDDAAWMIRCAAVRDALHRSRGTANTAKEILAELGGGDVAVATGILVGATARRLPVLLDGPVGVAAAMVSRDLGGQARHWCLLADHGGHPAVVRGADVLGLNPLLDLRLDLGEGANALAALPLLRSVLALARALPAHPALGAADDPEATAEGTEPGPEGGATPPEREEVEPEFAEPEPEGPGPARVEPTQESEPQPRTPAEEGSPQRAG